MDNWASTLEKIYLAFSRIFDGFLKFLEKITPDSF